MKNLLKEKRKALNLTQKQVAEKCGIQFQVYQRYENGIRFPNVLLVIKIANAFKTTVEALWSVEKALKTLPEEYRHKKTV